MSTTKILPIAIWLVTATLAGAATAAPRQIEGWVAGGSARYGNDDNVFRHEENEIDSDFVQLDAALGYGVGSQVTFFELLAEVDRREYTDSEGEVDNVESTNAELTGIIQWQANKSNRIELHGVHARVQEYQDQTNRDFDGDSISSDGDEFFYSDAGLVYHIGHGANLVAAELGINHHWRRYLNNRRGLGTSENALKDRDVGSANVSLYYQFSPYFRLVLTGKYDDYDYVERPSRLNAENVSGLLGIEWENETSRLWIRGGVEEKEFDQAAEGIHDGDMGIWQLGYVGKFSETAGFEITSSARILEGTNVEEYVEQIISELKFNAALTDTISMSLGYAYTDEEFIDGCNGNGTPSRGVKSNETCYDGREDTLKEVSFRLHYTFIPDLAIGIDYRFTERESNLKLYSYERNVVSLFLETSI